MSTYSVWCKAKAEATRNVAYQCENCEGAFSYQLVLSQEAGEGEEDYFSTPESRRQLEIKLTEKAGKSAIELLNNQIKALNENENYGFEECPDCEHVQSWMPSRSEDLEVNSAQAGQLTVITLLLGAIAYFLPRNDLLYLDQTLTCIITFALWAIFMKVFIDRLQRTAILESDQDLEKVSKRNSPKVDWQGPMIVE